MPWLCAVERAFWKRLGEGSGRSSYLKPSGIQGSQTRLHKMLSGRDKVGLQIKLPLHRRNCVLSVPTFKTLWTNWTEGSFFLTAPACPFARGHPGQPQHYSYLPMLYAYKRHANDSPLPKMRLNLTLTSHFLKCLHNYS